VFGEARLSINADDTTETLTPRLAKLGAETLTRLLPRILTGELQSAPQSTTGITHAPPLTKDNGKLDFTQDAAQLERQIRAMNPWPMASAMLGSNRVAIGRAHIVDHQGTPGEVLQADKHGVVVACGARALALDEVQLPGKRMMPSSAWVAGRGIAIGAQLTTAP
jgi:methionyl-tRNA formyltransferase